MPSSITSDGVYLGVVTDNPTANLSKIRGRHNSQNHLWSWHNFRWWSFRSPRLGFSRIFFWVAIYFIFSAWSAERAGALTTESSSAAANMVDFFPLMRRAVFSTCPEISLLNKLFRHIPTWAPFSDFKVKALETRKAVEAMMEIPFEQVKVDMVGIGLWKHMWRKDSPHHSSRNREPLFRRIRRRCWVPSVIPMAVYRPKMRRISKGRLERCLLV